MVDKISIEIGFEGGDDVRKTLEEIVGSVDNLKDAAEELGKTDATVAVKAEGADDAKAGIDDVKTAAGELGQTDATLNVKTEGADEAKASIDGVKSAAEELSQTDATIKIGVEGADEAKASFQGMAEGANEAKGALDPISQTATILSAGIDTMQLSMHRAEAAFDSLGAAAVKMGARMTRSLGILGVFARALGPVGIAVGVVAGALVKFGDSSADSLNKLNEASAKLDLSVQNFDKLQKALQQTGIASDAIAPGLEKLKETLSQGFFQTDVITGLQNFIAQLERMPDGAERTNLAMKTLGDTLGAQVIAGLQTGALSANNFAAALGAVTPATQQQIVEAAKYQQALNQLSAAWTEFKSIVTPITTPVFEFLTRELKILRLEIGYLIAQWNLLVAAIRVLDASSLESQQAAAKQVVEAYKALTAAGEELKQGTQQIGQAAAQTGQQLQLVSNPFTGMPEAINATNQALAQTGQAAAQAGQQSAQAGQTASQGFMVWDEKLGAITQKQAELAQSSAQAGQASAQAAQQGTSAWQTLPAAVDQANATVIKFASTMGTIAWDTISGLGVQAWNALTAAIQGALDKLLKFIGLRPSGGAPAAEGAPGKARGGLLGGRGTGTSDSNLAWLSRGEYVMPARAVRQPGVLSFLEALRRGGNIPAFQDGGLTSLIEGSGFDPGEFVRELKKSLEGVIAQIEAALMNAISEIDSVSLARGGLLGGRGTGTSDSNLAWVSRGEHIMPARAVAQPGVLAFLEALRRSGGNLSRVLDGMGRFALGGMVPRVMPAFANGGLAGGMSNVTIQFPGLPAIGGLRASSDVVDQLHKAAALAQVRSGGRKPSRYS